MSKFWRAVGSDENLFERLPRLPFEAACKVP